MNFSAFYVLGLFACAEWVHFPIFFFWGGARQKTQHTHMDKGQNSKQGRRNFTKSEGASKTSTSSPAKTNPSRKHFYADLCLPRLGESFSVWKLRVRKKVKILRKKLSEKWEGPWPRGPSRSYAYDSKGCHQGHGWRMPYGRCGRCRTNFSSATPTFCPLDIAGHTNNTADQELAIPTSGHDFPRMAGATLILWRLQPQCLILKPSAYLAFPICSFSNPRPCRTVKI